MAVVAHAPNGKGKHTHVQEGGANTSNLNLSVSSVPQRHVRGSREPADKAVGPNAGHKKGCHVCYKCGKSRRDGADLQACAACLAAWYCGRECQRAHWLLHKGDCKAKRDSQGEATAGRL